jgi:hypothetical protein
VWLSRGLRGIQLGIDCQILSELQFSMNHVTAQIAIRLLPAVVLY